jgi:hypothetical protein
MSSRCLPSRRTRATTGTCSNERIRELYRARGHNEAWIEARIRNDLARNELTDEWHDRGAKEGVEYAILTNEISEGTFNLTVQAYKQYKILPKSANLRDHMTTMELVLCSLGEATAVFHIPGIGMPRMQPAG